MRFFITDQLTAFVMEYTTQLFFKTAHMTLALGKVQPRQPCFIIHVLVERKYIFSCHTVCYLIVPPKTLIIRFSLELLFTYSFKFWSGFMGKR